MTQHPSGSVVPPRTRAPVLADVLGFGACVLLAIAVGVTVARLKAPAAPSLVDASDMLHVLEVVGGEMARLAAREALAKEAARLASEQKSEEAVNFREFILSDVFGREAFAVTVRKSDEPLETTPDADTVLALRRLIQTMNDTMAGLIQEKTQSDVLVKLRNEVADLAKSIDAFSG